MEKLTEYQKQQKKWVKENKVKAGSKVKVLRAAIEGEEGWDNSWQSSMNKSVGEILTIERICEDIEMVEGYGYPYFVLEIV